MTDGHSIHDTTPVRLLRGGRGRSVRLSPAEGVAGRVDALVKVSDRSGDESDCATERRRALTEISPHCRWVFDLTATAVLASVSHLVAMHNDRADVLNNRFCVLEGAHEKAEAKLKLIAARLPIERELLKRLSAEERAAT